MKDVPELPEKLRNLLLWAVAAGASDLHLIPGYPPVLRLHGDLTELPEEPALAADETREMLAALCNPEALARLQKDRNQDLSFEIRADGQVHRFRANLFHAGGQLGACFRVVPS